MAERAKPTFGQYFQGLLGGHLPMQTEYLLNEQNRAVRQREMEMDALAAVGQTARGMMGGSPGGAGAPDPVSAEMGMLSGGMQDAPGPKTYSAPIGPGMDGEPLPGVREPAPRPMPQQAQRQPASLPAAPPRLPTYRDWAPVQVAAINSGNPAVVARANALASIFDKAGPEVEFVNGLGVDKRDSGSVGRFIPSLDKGQEPLFDSNGRIVAVRNMDGSVKAAADMAGAVTGAQELAKAGLDLIYTEADDGSAVQETRAQAVDRVTGGAGGLPALPGGGGPRPPVAGAGGAAPRLGVRQSPAQQARDVGLAGLDVEGAKRQQTATFDLPKLEDQASAALGVLGKIKAHPSLRSRTGNSAAIIPLSPQDVDFEALRGQAVGGAFLEAIETLKGAGQITEVEGAKATAAITRIGTPRMSEEGFLEAVRDYEAVINTGLERARRAASGAAPASGAALPPPPSKDQLRVGQTYQTPRGPMTWNGKAFVQ